MIRGGSAHGLFSFAPKDVRHVLDVPMVGSGNPCGTAVPKEGLSNWGRAVAARDECPSKAK
eukprot:5280825-Prorocentrum_lima.AAC.1